MSRNKYVILGGGMAAGYAAKEMVSRGLRPGELAIISAEDALPYERPPLSKGFLAGKETEDSILINKPEWYREHGIVLHLKTSIDRLDEQNQRLHAATGEVFDFEKLLIASGARARKLDVPGHDLPNVFYLRSLQDSQRIRSQAATARRAAIVGGGFIGMEVASVLAQKNIEITMIFPEDRVWSRVFTPGMSEFFEGYYAARGVRLLKGESVAALEGSDSVGAVDLSSGRKIPCDLVVAGAGAMPVIEFLSGSGLALNNGVVVNEYLETSRAGISAAGDIANYLDILFSKRRRVEHWDNAVSQGQYWAAALLGERRPFRHVPYFFSDVFDLSYELWGDAEGADQIVSRGDLHTPSFSVWWLKNSRVVCCFVMNRPDDERQAAPEWIESQRSVSPQRLADPTRPIQEALSD